MRMCRLRVSRCRMSNADYDCSSLFSSTGLDCRIPNTEGYTLHTIPLASETELLLCQYSRRAPHHARKKYTTYLHCTFYSPSGRPSIWVHLSLHLALATAHTFWIWACRFGLVEANGSDTLTLCFICCSEKRSGYRDLLGLVGFALIGFGLGLGREDTGGGLAGLGELGCDEFTRRYPSFRLLIWLYHLPALHTSYLTPTQ